MKAKIGCFIGVFTAMLAFAQVDVVVIPQGTSEAQQLSPSKPVVASEAERTVVQSRPTASSYNSRNRQDEIQAIVVLDNPPQKALTEQEELNRIRLASVTLTVPIRDATLRQTIMGIAAIAKMNIVAPPADEFADLVNIRGNYQPLDLLNTLADMYGFSYKFNGTAWMFFRDSHNRLVQKTYVIKHNNRHEVQLSSAKMEGMTSRNGSGSSAGGSGVSESSGSQAMYEVNTDVIVNDIRAICAMNIPAGDADKKTYVTQEATAAGDVIYIPEQNTLIVTTTLHHHKMIESYLAQVDKPQRQIRLDVIFVETSRNPSSDLGVDWTGMSGASIGVDGLDFGPINWSRPLDTQRPIDSFVRIDDLQVALNFLSQDDKSNIMNRSDVVVVEGQYAENRSVVEMPYKDASYSSFSSSANGLVEGSVTYQEIGTIIGLAPQIVEGPTAGVPGKAVKIYFSITSSIPAGEVTIDGNPYPVIAKREYKYPVIIPNGHALAIGGLSEAVTSVGNTRVPLLGDIPVLGYLFKKQTKSNSVRRVIAYIIPRILDESTKEFTPEAYETRENLKAALDRVNEVEPPKPPKAESPRTLEKRKNAQRQVAEDKFLRAAISGDLETVKRITREAGWPGINASDAKGNTILHVCAFYGYETMAQWALRAGADASLTNDLGQTPRDMARGKPIERML